MLPEKGEDYIRESEQERLLNIGIRTSLRGKKSILKNSNRSPIQEKKVSYDDRVDEDAKERANEFHRKGYMSRKEGRFEEAIRYYT